jgi:hypothetical protein
LGGFLKMATTTTTKKQEEVTIKNPVEATVKAAKEAVAINETVINNWTNSLDGIFASYQESEKLLLKAIENQKETWGKVTADLTKIAEEQQKLYAEFKELVILNVQNVFGPAASKSLEQLSAQFEEINARIVKITEVPYKEGLNFLNQAQDQFEQLAKNGIEQQQKLREEYKEQIKATQKLFIDFYESTTKASLTLFK